MSLLRSIQDAAIDSSVKLSDLLRKCKVLAARLGHEEFKKWIESELNGYREGDILPEYRKLEVESVGHFSGPFGSGLRNAPIPPSCVPREYRQYVTSNHSVVPISTLIELLEDREATRFSSPWPPDLAALVGQDIYENLNCLSAWQWISRGQIVGILDAVRNRILDFAIEIESEAPNAGEAELGHQPLSGERVNQIFNTKIMGNVTNLAAGSQGFAQGGVVSIAKGDWNALLDFLCNVIGLDTEDIGQLKQSVETDRGTVGEQTGAWIGRMISKATTGALNVGASVASNLLTKAISQYLGI